MPAMDNMAGNIFLIGLMGAGKTTHGKQLAALLHRDFVDSDQLICQRTGVSIPTIFELEGEAGFRKREAAVIDELTRRHSLILATGGGAILAPENRQCLQNRGTVIYLHATPEILYQRIRYDKSRPLLQVADPLDKLKQLYQQRDPLYRATAHLVFNISPQHSCPQITKQLLHLIQQSSPEAP
ncbi:MULTISPECIES: shikimate kinase [Eikenella]|uniref:Shikimate kinase n=1 Tax=Eikenella longinqua TaxID=1795827 RepID=A0A1A9RY97_9NEIS|nr:MULTISPECIES: shikimate kinase [Eikenella]OAM27733.1 shikimate kinase [Eikenella longinqua]